MKTVTIRHLAQYETSVHKFRNFGEDLWRLWRDDKRVRIDLDEIDRADTAFSFQVRGPMLKRALKALDDKRHEHFLCYETEVTVT